jgi:hypothetical protein
MKWIRTVIAIAAIFMVASAAWSRTPEREKEMCSSDPVMETRYVFFHLRSRPFETPHLVSRRSSADSARLLTLFNRGLGKVRESGRAGTILESAMKGGK